MSALDTPRITFLDRLTPRQAVLLHYFWGLASDALNGDMLMFDSRLRWLDAYAREMRATPDGQRQIDLITARVSGLAEQLAPEERSALGIQVADDATAEVKCIRCGCTDERACPGGCSWASTRPPICSKCVGTEDFHAHLDVCAQCRDHPFNLCPIGDKLIRAAAGAI